MNNACFIAVSDGALLMGFTFYGPATKHEGAAKEYEKGGFFHMLKKSISDRGFGAQVPYHYLVAKTGDPRKIEKDMDKMDKNGLYGSHLWAEQLKIPPRPSVERNFKEFMYSFRLDFGEYDTNSPGPTENPDFFDEFFFPSVDDFRRKNFQPQIGAASQRLVGTFAEAYCEEIGRKCSESPAVAVALGAPLVVEKPRSKLDLRLTTSTALSSRGRNAAEPEKLCERADLSARKSTVLWDPNRKRILPPICKQFKDEDKRSILRFDDGVDTGFRNALLGVLVVGGIVAAMAATGGLAAAVGPALATYMSHATAGYLASAGIAAATIRTGDMLAARKNNRQFQLTDSKYAFVNTMADIRGTLSDCSACLDWGTTIPVEQRQQAWAAVIAKTVAQAQGSELKYEMKQRFETFEKSREIKDDAGKNMEPPTTLEQQANLVLMYN